jgi:hypothetical protein
VQRGRAVVVGAGGRRGRHQGAGAAGAGVRAGLRAHSACVVPNASTPPAAPGRAGSCAASPGHDTRLSAPWDTGRHGNT